VNSSKFFHHILIIIFLGLALPVLGSWISISFFMEWRLVHVPFHSLIEGLGGFIALTLAGLLLAEKNSKPDQLHHVWMACALISMGILDIFHAAVLPGNLFVWLHSTAQFVGGLFFALVWLPKHLTNDSLSARFPLILFVGISALGVLSLNFPEMVPAMVNQGKFSLLAKFLNILGGLGFLIAAVFFIVRFRSHNIRNDYLFAIHCTLFGAAGVLFEQSQLWDAAWWWWHFLRLMAYSAGLIYAVSSFLDTGKVLLDNKTFLNSILENLQEGVITIDKKGTINLVNAKTEHMFGYPSEELIGKNITLLISESSLGKFQKELARLLKTGESKAISRSIEMSGLRIDGSIFPIKLELTGISHNKTELFIALVRDITEQKVAENKLMHYTHELERSNKDLENFTSIASHDMREPLRKIISFGDRLVETESQITSRGKDYINRMQKASSRMNILIDDLLNFSRVTCNPGSFETVNFKKVVDQVVEDLDMKIAEEKATIIVEEMPTLEADLFQIRQLFQNLIANSLKYHREGVPPVIEVKSAKNGSGTWEIRIKDNGIGFNEKYAQRIFRIFERLHGRSTYEGTGIGLAICERIVTRHNGTITAKSKVGGGSTFIVTLPEIQPVSD